MENTEDFETIKTNSSSIVSQLKKIPEVKAAYLFGSYAAGKEEGMGICVITEKNAIQRSRRLEILSCAGRNVRISLFCDLPVFVKAKLFEDNGGTLLFCKGDDEHFLSGVKLAVMNEYLDFRPVLERFTRAYIAGPGVEGGA